jgi:hypothetical protein
MLPRSLGQSPPPHAVDSVSAEVTRLSICETHTHGERRSRREAAFDLDFASYGLRAKSSGATARQWRSDVRKS